MKADYNKQMALIESSNIKINVFNSTIKTFKRKHNKRISDKQKILSSYLENKSNAIEGVFELI